MNLLVISDLHVGPKARAQDFSTVPDDMSCRNTPDYLNDFKNLVKTEDIKVSHILIAGDITQSALYDEFELAASNIIKIAEILNVKKTDIFFIPGNHDSNWRDEKSSVENNEPEHITLEKKYLNISRHPFFSDLLNNAHIQDMYKSPFGTIWVSDELIVMGVNSSAKDGVRKDIHHGSIELHELDALGKELVKIDCNNKLKVLLTHHHPKNYTDRTFPDNDFSIMQNAEAFLRFATENEFDVIVHGHKHIPRFGIHSDALNYPIVSLSAGSFSASLKDYHNGVANFFHIIQIEGNCPKNYNVLGRVTTWAYFDNNKWIQADKGRDFISHEEYFGDCRNRKVLKEHFRKAIKLAFNDGKFFRWKEHLLTQPELKYCNLHLRESAVSDVCAEEGWEYCAMKNDDFLILSEEL
ncbi:metallophosphoesterase family protein [Pseudoalteromonas shioyasakiensis]|uniref:metallophosphoesterase family protein n=1 Tax=Pseudoalteromonas shioyasakiensis TaxID=1190813 RepID=UPI002551DD14|nr:metallophosphoesterase [Pseudoalteromonas shioyasakiensis]MDK9681827.1 metallophosphoesterase [Pseudoalteromonas shioyasakiensis]